MSGGFTKILDTKTFEAITYRPLPIGKVRINIGERPIAGIPYLRNSNMRPVDSRISNTPRLGQSSGLPDRRKNTSTGGKHTPEHMEGGKHTPEHMEGGDDDRIKKAVKNWKSIWSDMSSAEKKNATKYNDAFRKLDQIGGSLSSEDKKMVGGARAVRFLSELEQPQDGGSLFGSLKKGFKKLGKKTGKALKKTGKAFGKAGKAIGKAGKAVGKVAKKVGKKAVKATNYVAKKTKGIASVVGTVADVGLAITSVVPGLQEFAPMMAGISAAAKGVKEIAKKTQRATRILKKGSTADKIGLVGDLVIGHLNKKAAEAKRNADASEAMGIMQEASKAREQRKKDHSSFPDDGREWGPFVSASNQKGGQDEPAVNRFGITPGPRGNDKMSFVATHPLNYRKARLASLMRV
tara:strand:+ start:1525 stop:2742 length:1218 start_codon:yes stop_codon:yes gene_type:complete